MFEWTYWVAVFYGGLLLGGNIYGAIGRDDVEDRVGSVIATILSGIVMYWLVYRVGR